MLPSFRQAPPPSESPRTAAQLMCHLIAYMIFGVGLISPLTPTHGAPSWGELLFYAGGPFALLCVSWTIADDRAARIAVAIELVVLAALSATLSCAFG